jgi:hypothetical protein
MNATTRAEAELMTTIERRLCQDIVLNGDVRLAIAWAFTSSAEPQTRLFWV